ncbi:MAG TPA: formate/nitrite transporter family protein [Gemmatimonadaceae bacterium]|nr:formate/nitrite transporter family protein [Gemmatimonadaceae bacterium]
MPPYQAVSDARTDERREPPPGQGADLEEKEKRKADEEESLNASITYEVIRREGEKELERSPQALAWSGLAAGLSMGFILVAEGLLRSHLPDAPWRPLVAKLGYSVGFLIVILGSQQLYTENTLTPIVPLLARKGGELLGRVLRLWAIVLATNLIGTILFAWVLARTTLFEPDAHAAFLGVASEALRSDFLTTFLRAIFAGWIIALMVWMLPAASSEQVPVIVVMTYLVGVAGLSHIVAGSAEVAYLVARGAASWGDYFMGFVIPAALGNTLGGVTLVASLNHAQVVGGNR